MHFQFMLAMMYINTSILPQKYYRFFILYSLVCLRSLTDPPALLSIFTFRHRNLGIALRPLFGPKSLRAAVIVSKGTCLSACVGYRGDLGIVLLDICAITLID